MTGGLVLRIRVAGSDRAREVPIAPDDVEDARALLARSEQWGAVRDGNAKVAIVPVGAS